MWRVRATPHPPTPCAEVVTEPLAGLRFQKGRQPASDVSSTPCARIDGAGVRTPDVDRRGTVGLDRKVLVAHPQGLRRGQKSRDINEHRGEAITPARRDRGERLPRDPFVCAGGGDEELKRRIGRPLSGGDRQLASQKYRRDA